MSAALAQAHIVAQARIRALTARQVQTVWAALPAYNTENVDEWLARVLPVVAAGQRAAVATTEAFLARRIGRQPLGVNPDRLIGAAVRNGTEPTEVYRRPFVTVWTALGAKTALAAAVAQGLARAGSTAETDVQLSMRSTLQEVGEADDLILGYQRVPDGGACDYCLAASEQRYGTADLMPIHNRCGCGVDVITGAQRPDFTGSYDRDLVHGDVTAAVKQHGELGPVLVDAAQHFTSEQDL